MPDKRMETSCVEVQAVITTAWVSSGVLARFGTGADLAIVPADGSNLMVTLEAAGQRLLRAAVRNEGGKLVATITAFASDHDEGQHDEWHPVATEPA